MNTPVYLSFTLWAVCDMRKTVFGGTDHWCCPTFMTFLSFYRAFSAWEENLPVDVWAEQQQKRLLAEYKAKLVVEGETLEDPFETQTGWTGEKDGLTKWPFVYFLDISMYLNGKNPEDLMGRLLNEYKVGKAYRYFTAEWVKEVFYHDINSKSDKCVVKVKVTPSQAVNNKPYDVWIVIRKDNGDVPGGQILSAYCTCTAGMLGSCNHIAGALFRIEHAVKTGITKPTSTSQLCQWTIPKKQTKIHPKKVTDFVWKKSHYTKSQIDLNKENEMSAKKRSFTPLTKSQETKIQDVGQIRQELHTLLRSDMPNSCFSLLMDKRRIETDEKTEQVPDTLIDIAASIPKDGTLSEQKALLMSKIKMTGEQRESLMKVTLSQSECSEWKEHRCGRVTASLFHRLCLRAKSLRADTNEDPTSVIKAVMKDQPCIQTKFMKHGLSMEPVAKRAYMCVMKSEHKLFKARDSGLIVHKEKSFVAASPDLLVECKCCGEGLCEIKCPETIKHQKPSVENVPYLTMDKEGTISVIKKHPYYYQIQGQMGISERKYCDFFVYTHHGHICTRIVFDQDFFNDMMKELTWFWENYIVDELLTRDTKRVLKEKMKN